MSILAFLLPLGGAILVSIKLTAADSDRLLTLVPGILVIGIAWILNMYFASQALKQWIAYSIFDRWLKTRGQIKNVSFEPHNDRAKGAYLNLFLQRHGIQALVAEQNITDGVDWKNTTRHIVGSTLSRRSGQAKVQEYLKIRGTWVTIEPIIQASVLGGATLFILLVVFLLR